MVLYGSINERTRVRHLVRGRLPIANVTSKKGRSLSKAEKQVIIRTDSERMRFIHDSKCLPLKKRTPAPEWQECMTLHARRLSNLFRLASKLCRTVKHTATKSQLLINHNECFCPRRPLHYSGGTIAISDRYARLVERS